MPPCAPCVRLGLVQRASLVAAVIALGSSALCAQLPPDGAASAPIFREDLGRSYLRLERALAQARGLPAALRSRVNRLFDRASMSLYGRWKSRAVELIDQAWLLVTANSPGAAGERPGDQQQYLQTLRAAVAVRAEPEPFLLRFDRAGASRGPTPQLRLRLLRPWTDNADAAVPVQLRIQMQGRVLLQQPCVVRSDRVEPAVVSLQGLTPFAGRARILLTGGALREPVEIGVLQASRRSLEQVQQRTLATLAAVAARQRTSGRPLPKGLSLAASICRSRARLLTDTPSPDVTAHFLLDLAQLAREVEQEAQAVEAGRNPYRLREGDLWLELPVRGAVIPARLYASPKAVHTHPAPLIIALHGAGGDESLFMEGYGAGRLRDLAREKGFLLLTPRTNPFLEGSRQALDDMLDALEQLYAVDRQRVYVMGHSLGAGVAATLARTASDKVAACVCFAGGGGWAGLTAAPGSIAPTRVFAGALDPIIPARGTLAAAQDAHKRGLPVEWTMLPAAGHTLFVGRVLDEAVDWLLQRRLGPSSDAASAR
ncbi:MAG: hypothetical protein D6824_09300 [Planctomycetota bacterium]|nr:MAG: hypothetical protein D6824_09300 [Planctomycetota bacterium]